MISIYEAPSMNLLDKKSLKIDGVKEFSWSKGNVDPKGVPGKEKHYISYWTPEVGNQPARVTLMSIPDRQILRTKNLFNVNSVSKSPFLSVCKILNCAF
jgi:translation initiation factor 3 subunit B